MQVRGKTGVAAPIAFVLAILLVVVVVAAGFLWIREAEAKLQAQQELAALQKKYQELKEACQTIRSGGASGGGLSFNRANPVLENLKQQTDIPMCEKPVIKPVSQQMREQDKPFFAPAQKGDVLISFPINNVVYLYRPSTGQLLNTAQLPSKPTPAMGGLLR